ncbi:MAG: hypothetical protein Q9222_003189 [Ikaeria aurantiellina]
MVPVPGPCHINNPKAPDDSDSHGLSTGAEIGLIVGLGVPGVIFLICFVVFFMRRNDEKRGSVKAGQGERGKEGNDEHGKLKAGKDVELQGLDRRGRQRQDATTTTIAEYGVEPGDHVPGVGGTTQAPPGLVEVAPQAPDDDAPPGGNGDGGGLGAERGTAAVLGTDGTSVISPRNIGRARDPRSVPDVPVMPGRFPQSTDGSGVH